MTPIDQIKQFVASLHLDDHTLLLIAGGIIFGMMMMRGGVSSRAALLWLRQKLLPSSAW